MLMNADCCSGAELARKCVGANPCSACTTCTGCKHCAKDRGSCGVCIKKGDGATN